MSELFQKYDWSFICQSFEETISMAKKNDFIYCDPPYIGRHVDYYDSWNEQAEISLHKLLVDSNARFMLSTWDHNDYRQNDYIALVWGDCEKITQEHFYHVGAKEKNRNPVIEALLTNYTVNGKQNEFLSHNEQITLFDMVSAL